MDTVSFYVITNKPLDNKKYAYAEQAAGFKVGDFEKCKVCGRPISSRKWLPPLKVELSNPSYGDFVFGTFNSFLVSERFKNAYLNSNISGIMEFQSVEVVHIKESRSNSPEPPQYYLVSIEIGKARIDENLSNFVRSGLEACEVCRTGGVIKWYDGVFIIPETWSGEDIFYPIGLPGTIIVTNKFCTFVKEYGFTNIKFEPAEEHKPGWKQY